VVQLQRHAILVNTEKGRQKYRNMSRRRAVTILAIDPDDDSRWPEVRGTVVGETEEGQRAIDELARLYMGIDKYSFHQEGDVRVLFKVAPMESAMPNFTRQPDLLSSIVRPWPAGWVYVLRPNKMP
jgi:hypothetical protein